MARWIEGDRLIRMIHLVSSMILLVFLTMYAVTGIIMIHHRLPFGEQDDHWTRQPVERAMTGSPGEYARYLKEEYGYKGRTEYRQFENGSWEFYFELPGLWTKVTLPDAQDTLFVQQTHTQRTLMTVSHYLHGMRGFKGGWIYTTWAVFYDCSAVAMILFGITGVIIWFKGRKRYPSGWWYLAAGLIIPLLFVLAFLFSR